MQYPAHQERAPESELKRYLEEGASILAGAPASPTDPPTVGRAEGQVSDDFEHLRWFDLPAVCLATRPPLASSAAAGGADAGAAGGP
jgi:hypothetical protein